MKVLKIFMLVLVFIPFLWGRSMASPVDDLLAEYGALGAGKPAAESGRDMWTREFPDPKGGQKRSCVSCHGVNLSLPGKHIKTGKPIDPLAPSVNPKRLTETKKIRKWFKRNCKWTLGRECTPGEKADFLEYLRGL